MGFFDYVSAGNQALGGYFSGRNEASQDAWRRQSYEREQKRLEEAQALQQYAQEQSLVRQQQSDLAEAPLRAAQTKYYQSLADSKGSAPGPYSPEAIRAYGQKKAIDSKYPSFGDMKSRRDDQQKQQAEEAKGLAILNSILAQPGGKPSNPEMARGFSHAFRSIRESNPDMTPGRVALQAYEGLTSARPELRPKVDPNGNIMTPRAPSPQAPQAPQAPTPQAPAPQMGGGGDDPALMQQRDDWDELARQYGPEETTRQIGPRP